MQLAVDKPRTADAAATANHTEEPVHRTEEAEHIVEVDTAAGVGHRAVGLDTADNLVEVVGGRAAEVHSTAPAADTGGEEAAVDPHRTDVEERLHEPCGKAAAGCTGAA